MRIPRTLARSIAALATAAICWLTPGVAASILEALRGKAGRELDPMTLAGWVGSRVAELTLDRQHPYIPLLTEFPARRPILYAGP